MKIITITGNIGSGKTYISKLLSKKLNLPLISVDDFSKKCIELEPLLFRSILADFGILCNSESIKGTIRDNLFKNKQFKALVEEVVANSFWSYIDTLRILNQFPVIIVEHPLLFERQDQFKVDFIIGVETPLDVRRTEMKIRGYSEKTIQERLENQIPLLDNFYKIDRVLHNHPFLNDRQILHEIRNSRKFKETFPGITIP